MRIHHLNDDMQSNGSEEARFHLQTYFDQLTQACTTEEKIDLLQTAADDLSNDDWLDTFQNAVNQTINDQLIYTSDIRELWDDMGEPDPVYSELGDFDSISDAITAAVTENLIDDPGGEYCFTDEVQEGALDYVRGQLEDLSLDFDPLAESIPELLESAIDNIS